MLLRDAFTRLKSRILPHESLGRRGERAAVKFLKRLRYKILHRSYRILGGELDIVAIEHMSKLRIPTVMREAVSGRHVERPEITCSGCGGPISVLWSKRKFQCPSCSTELRVDG